MNDANLIAGAGPVGQPSPDTQPPPSGLPVPTLYWRWDGGGGQCQKRQREHATRRVPLVEQLKDLPWFEADGHKKYQPGKRPKFSGELQTPIVQALSAMPVIDGVAHLDEAINSIFNQRIEKLMLLLKYYGIENTSDPWLFLSLRLACSFVPGLRVLIKPPRGPGRPAKWKGQTRDELVAAVAAVRAERAGRSVSKAIDILKCRDPERWKSLNEARYYEARRDQKLRDQAVRAFRQDAPKNET